MTEEQNTLYEMLQKRNSKSDSEIEKLLRWNDEIEHTEEVVNGHSLRVANLSKSVAERLNLSEKETTAIYFAALFHDIGKYFIPKEIIGKKEKLTPEEFETIKTHCQIAEDILKNILDYDIIEIVKQHHERLDGSGYPKGIITENIGAKILGIVDSYDAMTSQRVYNHTMSKEETFKELELCTKPFEESGKGKLYDSDIVDLFKEIVLSER